MLVNETLITIAIAVFLLTMIALVVMVGKMLFDTSGNSHGSTVYMLRVSRNGDIKIKRYRGNVKYWTDLDD